MENYNFNVFTYGELTEYAKNNAIENFKNKLKDDYIINDFYMFSEDTKIEIENLNFEDVELYYSLNFCQGDGLMFEGCIKLSKLLENEYFVKNKLTEKEINKIKRILKVTDINITVKHNNSMYFHSNTANIDFYFDYANSWNYEKTETFINDIIENSFEEYYKELCREFEEKGYNIYRYYWKDENIVELLKENNYRFYQDGKIFFENSNYNKKEN